MPGAAPADSTQQECRLLQPPPTAHAGSSYDIQAAIAQSYQYSRADVARSELDELECWQFVGAEKEFAGVRRLFAETLYDVITAYFPLRHNAQTARAHELIAIYCHGHVNPVSQLVCAARTNVPASQVHRE